MRGRKTAQGWVADLLKRESLRFDFDLQFYLLLFTVELLSLELLRPRTSCWHPRLIRCSRRASSPLDPSHSWLPPPHSLGPLEVMWADML